MKLIMRFIVILASLSCAVAVWAMPKPDELAPASLASQVEYNGSFLDRYASDNFRVVIPGLLLRANQLQPPIFNAYITEHGIKAVINLIGAQPTEELWQQEVADCELQGVALYNLALKVHEFMQPQDLAVLLSIFDEAPGPLMIHCRRGVDRTGVAAGLWLLEKGGVTRQVACQQLNYLCYGHRGSKYPQMLWFITLWGALRSRYDRVTALREYQAIYERLKLGEVTMRKASDALLISCLGEVGNIVDDLERGV